MAAGTVAANHDSSAAMTPAKLWGWGLSGVGGNRFRAKALQVGFAGFREDWNACEYGSKQDRHHDAFHLGSSQSCSILTGAGSRAPDFAILRHQLTNIKKM